MAIHLVSFKPGPYNKGEATERPYDMDTWVLDGPDQFGHGRRVLVPNRFQRRRGEPIGHTLHFSGSNNVSNLPVPEQPWRNQATQAAHAYLVPEAIALVGGAGAEAYRAQQQRIQDGALRAQIGDLLVDPTLGVALRIVDGGQNHDTQVEIIEAPAATVDHAEFVAAQRAVQAANR